MPEQEPTKTARVGGPIEVRWALRAVLTVVLLLSLGLRFATQAAPDRDPILGITAVLGPRLSGPISHEGWGSQDNPSWVITAPVAGCASPLTIVTVVPPDFNSAAALEAFEKPGGRRYFAYLSWISDQPDRWGLLRMRIWQRAQEMLNIVEYVSPRVMLYIIEGADCHVVETSDWRRYWLAVESRRATKR
jgi:hypothetical protein